MALYDNNGTTSAEWDKVYDNNGTTSAQWGQAYDNNGTTSSLVYTAEETLTLQAKVNGKIYEQSKGASPSYNTYTASIAVPAGSTVTLDKLVWNTAIYCSIQVQIRQGSTQRYNNGPSTAGSTSTTTVNNLGTLTFSSAATLYLQVWCAAPDTSYSAVPTITATLTYTIS